MLAEALTTLAEGMVGRRLLSCSDLKEIWYDCNWQGKKCKKNTRNLCNGIVDDFKVTWDKAKNAAVKVANDAKDVAVKAANDAKVAAVKVVNDAKDVAVKAANDAKDVAVKAANDVKVAAVKAANDAKDLAVQVANDAKDVAVKLVNDAKDVAVNAANTLTNIAESSLAEITSGVTTIGNKIKCAASPPPPSSPEIRGCCTRWWHATSLASPAPLSDDTLPRVLQRTV